MDPMPTRRRVLAAGAAGAAALAGCIAPTGSEPAVDGWPLARRDPGRTGYNPDADGPALGRERWRVETGAAAATPVVADGTVYVGGDAVFAFDAADGAERWRRGLHYDTRSSPAVVDGTVYATSKFAFYAIEAATGRDRWFDNEGAFRFHSPVVVGGTLYLAATRVNDPDFGAQVVALSPADGAVRFRADVGGDVLPPFAPAVADGRVYAGRDAVYALDARTGDRAWTFRAPAVTAYGDPVVVDDTVYVAGTRPTSGEGPPGGIVLALDAGTGEERWRFETGLSPSPPAVAGGTVYVTSDAVYALSTGGAERWRLDSNRYVTAPPAATDRFVYLAGVAGDVRALAAADGTTTWRLPVAESMLAAPAVVGDRLFVASGAGRIAAIG